MGFCHPTSFIPSQATDIGRRIKPATKPRGESPVMMDAPINADETVYRKIGAKGLESIMRESPPIRAPVNNETVKFILKNRIGIEHIKESRQILLKLFFTNSLIPLTLL
jgi:hypothetical protein